MARSNFLDSLANLNCNEYRPHGQAIRGRQRRVSVLPAVMTPSGCRHSTLPWGMGVPPVSVADRIVNPVRNGLAQFLILSP